MVRPGPDSETDQNPDPDPDTVDSPGDAADERAAERRNGERHDGERRSGEPGDAERVDAAGDGAEADEWQFGLDEVGPDGIVEEEPEPLEPGQPRLENVFFVLVGVVGTLVLLSTVI
jgi:hypothetical protein